jgi:hypothetical protein
MSDIENAGLRGKSRESLANMKGLSTSDEGVGAGESGKVVASEKVVTSADESEVVFRDSTAVGETVCEG